MSKGSPAKPKPLLWFKFWTRGELALHRRFQENFYVRAPIDVL